MPTQAEEINERLLLYYGKELDGRARYRVVWSTDQIERRHGEYNEFYGHIFLRRTVGIMDVKKYPYDQDRWILEKLFYIPNKELVTERPGSYEPFHVLKNSAGEFLPLNAKVVDMIVHFAESKPVGIHLTDKDWQQQEQQEIEAEAEYFMNDLDNVGRSGLFASENSVFVDSTRRFK